MTHADNIRRLNDHARKSLTGCRLMITAGIQALGGIEDIISKVQSFDDFTDTNNPYQEHDFGSFEFAGKRIFWKFDYYDQSMTAASPNPADLSITERVLTIMLAEEY